ncbi:MULTISPECIES: c-type cytochrome [Campylobacter]|uniref:c-type cytochrome n=1 Tax=Campylobacter TaxID=194 RepID=UPI001EFAF9FA|nr:c-type cytochrome [Campylobacter sp. RM10537]MBZ7930794.1 c-type cytochrome [Campylobacter sp. RM12910]MBZ7933797.1 c-type cytochrome [Campylobacter sp. W0065]MBZ7938022.1 c-type cytochrome [Campylobacter sp. RM10538]MBZ7949300.1 c-type cytochrome [Campylobacter sp. RM10534]MBZ7970752.1 c-type cytochrome [Campylobacter sp. RM3125]MBZ7971686.1 c-type cytochrome [Campylobacter sp. RM3124]
MIFRLFFASSIFMVALFGVSLKSIFGYTFDANKKYNLIEAKKIYFNNKCNICHGDNGEKSSPRFKALKDMSAEEIKTALMGYTLDNASTMTSQMALYAKNLSHDDMDNIIAYIKGGDFALDLQVKDLIEKEPPKKTEHNIFLK